METLLGIIVTFAICFLPEIINDYKASNRTTPPDYKIDWAAMNRDMANGASKQQIYTNINNGKYDVPDKK